jgi:alcohol dehydrogenase (NADP+)
VCKGQKVGVVGLGGLGHMAVKLASSFGAEVTVFSTSPSKQVDAKRLGAHDFALTSKPGTMKSLSNRFDFIIDAVSAPHDYAAYLETLKTDGVMTCVGVPTEPMSVPAFSIIPRRRSVAGSMIGGIKETQEMLDYCAAHNITSDVEVIPVQQINEAYERVIKGQVKYRFVIDIASLKQP